MLDPYRQGVSKQQLVSRNRPWKRVTETHIARTSDTSKGKSVQCSSSNKMLEPVSHCVPRKPSPIGLKLDPEAAPFSMLSREPPDCRKQSQPTLPSAVLFMQKQMLDSVNLPKVTLRTFDGIHWNSGLICRASTCVLEIRLDDGTKLNRLLEYSGPSLKGHSLERKPLYKEHKFVTASAMNIHVCNAPSHQRTPL